MSATTLTDKAYERLANEVRGSIITPESNDYEDARSIYNGMIDKRPGLVVKCVDAADVIAAVRTAREHGLALAIRGGGHNGAGLAVVDDGIVIDLSEMNGIRVDPSESAVRVEGGATWGAVDHATHPFGLAVPNGVISTTGVAGLTLGGGHGYLSRKYGLTIDNLLEADVVLADGRLVTASERDHADLFWAIRGGGGNFGVVTSFKFRLRPVGNVMAGPTFWPLDQSAEVLRWYRDFIEQASRDLYGFFAFLTVPPSEPFPEELQGQRVCGVIWCYLGPEEEADTVFAPVKRVGEPAFHGVQSMPFPVFQSFHDALYPPGLQWYWKGDFVRELPEEAIEVHLQHGAAMPTPLSTMHLYPINGAVHDVPEEATAWSYRDVKWSSVIAGVSEQPEDREKITSWAKDYWQALHPFSAGASYINFLMEEGQNRVASSYRDNYNRLVSIKSAYDPENLFHVNQNIKPAV